MTSAALVTILLLHGGGFTGGLPSSAEPVAGNLRAYGYTVNVVPYRDENPNGNILGEIATVRRYAKEAAARGPVIAYGLSAGGTLAGALAARGEVDGAVVAGGPTNLLTWTCLAPLTLPSYWSGMGMTVADRREASPIFRLDGRQSPQLLLYGDIDPLVTIDQGLSYFAAAQHAQPDTKFTLMTLSPHAFRDVYRDQARQWIQQRWPVAKARTKPARLKAMHG
jgi:acetyl esterase/lipase